MSGALRSVATAAGRAALALARDTADLLAPRACAGCGASEPLPNGLCKFCSVRLLALVSLPYCPRCGATIGPNLPTAQGGCPWCPQPLGRFAHVVRLGPYAPPLRGAIHDLKYRQQQAALSHLGGLLAQAVRAQCPEANIDLLATVPMHWRRRIARGFDHARALGRTVARELRLPVGDELVRVRATRTQVSLSRTARRENVRGAFAVHHRRTVRGANVLLIDDVTTTGATANEATRALLGAGAHRVTLAVLAKAEPPRAYTAHWQT